MDKKEQVNFFFFLENVSPRLVSEGKELHWQQETVTIYEEFKGCKDSFDSKRHILEDLDNIDSQLFLIFISEIGQFYPFVGLIFFFQERNCM